MAKTVTVGIPVYKRLEYLPQVLKIVASQNYPEIELLVSDNGVNGRRIHEIVRENYLRPHRIRQNASTVPMSIHFNQIIQDASGEYFLLLADDDEISSNYISELVRLFERHPRASVAMGVQETVDEGGVTVRTSSTALPEILSGPDFVRAAWGTHAYGYESFSTFLARTADLIACGGFPDFWKGRGNDDALVVKLCFDNFVVFSPRCVFRKRFYAESFGFSGSTADLARAMNDFLKFLESDPCILRFARTQPTQWNEARRYLVRMIWNNYHMIWADRSQTKLSALEWLQSGFALPFIPAYYRAVVHTLASAVWRRLKNHGR